MRAIILSFLAVAFVPTLAHADRFHSDHRHSRGSFGLSFGFGTSSYHDYSYGSFSYSSGRYYRPAPVYVAPPVYYPQPVYVEPAPLYVAPRPVYVTPEPVYVAPRRVYVEPAPVIVAPPVVYQPGYRTYHHQPPCRSYSHTDIRFHYRR